MCAALQREPNHNSVSRVMSWDAAVMTEHSEKQNKQICWRIWYYSMHTTMSTGNSKRDTEYIYLRMHEIIIETFHSMATHSMYYSTSLLPLLQLLLLGIVIISSSHNSLPQMMIKYSNSTYICHCTSTTINRQYKK